MRKHSKEYLEQLTPAMCFELLKEGNQRFVSNLQKDHDHLEMINEPASNQFPWGCAQLYGLLGNGGADF